MLFVTQYFSERELGSKSRIEQVICPTVWAAIVGKIQTSLESGAFAESYPERCPDGNAIADTNEKAFIAQVVAEIPEIEWPLKAEELNDSFSYSDPIPFAPDTFAILDLLEFIFREISQPIQGEYHSYFRHYHLSFTKDIGQSSFCETINRLFSRNGIAYELQSNGQISRVLPAQLESAIIQANIRTGDVEFDRMLASACVKFTIPNPQTRYESLEKLWDAWERLKTFSNPANKKQSMTDILDKTASEPNFRQRLEFEAKELTDIGNSHLIRHSEHKQNPLVDLMHVDYLFHRMLSMINLLIPAVKMVKKESS